MPNREAHSIIGACSGAIANIAIAWDEPNFDQFCFAIGGAAGGFFGSSLPDIIEPANNPNHRKFFHSIVFNGALAAILLTTSKMIYRLARKIAKFGWDKMHEMEKPIEKFLWGALSISILLFAGVLTGAVAGYLSHIAADSTTSNSIPFLGIDSLKLN